MPSPVVNGHWNNLAVQGVAAMAVPRRRRRCSIRPNAPVRNAATLPKLAGSISGTGVGAACTVSSGLTAYIAHEFELFDAEKLIHKKLAY
jgi:hypothetical protein